MDRILDTWHLHRRGILITASLVAGLVAVLVAVAAIARVTGHRTDRTTARQPSAPARAASTSAPPSDSASPAAQVAASWNAVHPLVPSVSSDYPAIPTAQRRDPSTYAQAFAIELFTRNYATPRSELLGWAQYEDSALEAPNLPRQDWTKVLVDSLTDLTWDQALDTPVPSDGTWLALQSENTTDTVSDIRVAIDPQWERKVADGYQPPDPLATARDVSLTLTRTSMTAGRPTRARYAVSLALQLGSSPHGGYGVAATTNYVIKEIG